MGERSKGQRYFAGDRLRDLRKGLGVSQTVMAAKLGISVSYLSQIETGDRPISDAVLATLGRAFPFDWSRVSDVEDDNLLVRAVQAGGDPTVPLDFLDEQTVIRGAQQQPRLVRRMAAIHAAYQRSQEQLHVLDDRIAASAGEAGLLPWEEVRDWFQAEGNYVDLLDRAAERLAEELGDDGDPRSRVVARLEGRHGIRLHDRPPPSGERRVRDFDPASRSLFVDRATPPESQTFELVHQLMRLEAADEIAAISADAALHSGAARSLLQVGLANYAAGALLMPYGRFKAAARQTRHDVDELRTIFSVSFEQVCHRLSNLQRLGDPGIPFFFCRVDMAGNITKRHSATTMQFAQFGGACPLWIVHEAAAISDRILVQVADMPDGRRYVSMAKGLVKSTANFRRPPRRYAVALGCEVEHAANFVYADGVELWRDEAVVPIGPSCRICPRRDCEQRAFPPAGRNILISPTGRGAVPYAFE